MNMNRTVTFSVMGLMALAGSSLTGWGQTGILVALRHQTDGLRLTHTEIAPTSLEVLTDNAISSDGYPSGVADIDCFGERFFYVRGIPQRLVTADAVTGQLIQQVIVENPLDADVRLSNIAYDWTDDRLIGTAATTSTLGDTQLRLVEVNPTTGAVEVLSTSPAMGAAHGSGNCDLDAAGNRYFLLGATRLFTWDAMTGEMLGIELVPDLDTTASSQTLTHLAYHPLQDALYALHKRDPDSYDFGGPLFQSEMRLVRKDLPDGEWEFVSGEVISMDGIQSGQCDLDPFNDRYYYVQDGKVRVVDCNSGELQFTLNVSDPPGLISEWANLQFHDLSTPSTATIEVSEGSPLAEVIEWDGISELVLEPMAGAALSGNWTDGPGVPQGGNMMVSDFGTFSWAGARMGTNGGQIQVSHTFQVVPLSSSGLTHLSGPLDLQFSPNPARPGDRLHFAASSERQPMQAVVQCEWVDLGTGRVVQRMQGVALRELQVPGSLAPGMYILNFEAGGRVVGRSRIAVQ
jgi:hypothetical protein